MKSAQKAETDSLGIIIDDLKRGTYVIPDFQREFEWKPWDVRDLVKSIFQDYYIGTLLLWKCKSETFDALSCENIYGHKGKEKPDYIVLDGQQRLTAINYAFNAPDKVFPKRKSRVFYFLNLDKYFEGKFDELIDYQFETKETKEFLDNENKQFKTHSFPLSIIGEGTRSIIRWIDAYKKYWNSSKNSIPQKLIPDDLEEDKKVKLIAKIKSQYIENAEIFDKDLDELLKKYDISYIELDKDLGIDKVCDIFTQINSKGVKLDIFDLMNAMLKPQGIQLKDMWRKASPDLEYLGTSKANVYVLQVISILKQDYCSSKYLYYLLPQAVKKIRDMEGKLKDIILVETGDEFESLWKTAVSSLTNTLKAIENPRDYGAIKTCYIPYPSIIPVLSSIRQFVNDQSDLENIQAKQKIRKWYWSSIFTNRYSSSVESTSAKDFLELKKWFSDEEKEPQAVVEFNAQSELSLQKEIKVNSAIYRAILNLIVINGAKDLSTGDWPEHENLDDHHIVPKKWGKNNGLSKEINSICNRTLIAKNTNRIDIYTKMPSEYLVELLGNYDNVDAQGRNIAREILDSHFISEKAQAILMRDNFSPDDYREFIAERERSLRHGIKTQLLNELPMLENTHLDALNKDIEVVEIALRELICSVLENDESRLPQHILPKAKGRIQAMLKKDGAKEAQDFADMSSLLSYFDLRELEDVIKAKATWKDFAPIIRNKETFIKKIDQLAELRNPLRHSRMIDEVAHKEGDAAVVWFKKLLKIT